MQRPDFKQIPQSPGVYKFFKNRKLLYVGKALNLRNRVKSYFTSTQDSRIKLLVHEATRLDYQMVNSEIEALILESQLIKKLKPLFNIKLRDEKRYFYAAITKENFPKIYITHQVVELGKKFIGPFTDGTALKTTLRLLRKIFPYCTCKQTHNVLCLNYHIGNCLGFCCLKKKVSDLEKKTYRKNINAIKNILSGKKTALVKKLTKEMDNLAQNEKFEEAIELRQKIQKMERVFENAKILRDANPEFIERQTHTNTTNSNALKELKSYLRLSHIPKRIEGYDIANIQGKFATGSMVVFTNGQPEKKEYKKFKIRSKTTPDDIAMLKEVLERRFNHQEWPMPDLIILDGGKGQLNLAIKILKLFKFKIPIIALTKDAKHRGDHIFTSTKKSPIKLGDLPKETKNLILNIDSEAHRFAISYYRKLHRIRLIN
ncbi:MAG: GIY-YIG nuclease family protein [Parcubacteria group bacterium]|nr:GIY-YIG nuclease family protein [Parcubacteria group bacterium]